MIKNDDFDSISIEVTTERPVVWTTCRNAGGDRPAHTERDAEVLGSLVEGPSAKTE
jgi:hypothetical protein